MTIFLHGKICQQIVVTLTTKYSEDIEGIIDCKINNYYKFTANKNIQKTIGLHKLHTTLLK